MRPSTFIFAAAIGLGIFGVFNEVLYANAWTQPEGNVQFIPSFFYYTASNAFESDGSLNSLPYNGDFSEEILTLYGEWGATKDLTLIGDVPFGHFEFTANDSLHNYTDQLTPHFVYVGIGGRYAVLHTEHAILSLSTMFHIPPGFHRGLYNDSQYPFLSDGYFENISAVEFGVTNKWGWFEALLAYHARDEDPVNQLEIQATAGFSSRKDISVKCTVGVMKTLGPLPAMDVNPEQTLAQENYMWIAAQMMITLPGGAVVAPSLYLRLLGGHTMEFSGGGLAFIL